MPKVRGCTCRAAAVERATGSTTRAAAALDIGWLSSMVSSAKPSRIQGTPSGAPQWTIRFAR